MSRNSKEGIVLAMDCAKTMRDECRRGDRSVFEVSIQCLQNIVRQKIFAETKNEYLLMQFSASDGVRVVPQKGGLMCPPNFHLLRHLMSDLSDVTRVTSDPISVMDALDEAIKQLVDYTRLKKLSDKKIALLTNFGHFDDKDMHRFDTDIGERLRQLGIKLIIICDFSPNNHLGRDLSKSQIRALKLMEVVEQQELGFYYDLQTAVQQFSRFELKESSGVNSYFRLELGRGHNALNIPIAAVIKTYAIKRPTAQKAAAVAPMAALTTKRDPDERMDVDVERGVLYKVKDTDQPKEIEKEDLMYAYRYGQTLVAIDGEERMTYKNNEMGFKGFKILGFTSEANVDVSQRIGEQTRYLYPDARVQPPNHKRVFQALVAALDVKGMVAIVRYNWNEKSSPQIGCLVPHREDDMVVLVYHQLPFDEDVRKYRFPSLESKPIYTPTDDQLKAVDSLIDSMDLMSADTDDEGEPCEALLTDQIGDPSLQLFFQTLYSSHLDESGVDLTQMAADLIKTIDSPLEVREKVSKVLPRIAELFSLESTKSPKRRQSLTASQPVDQLEAKRARRASGVDIKEESTEIEIIKSEVNDMIKRENPFLEISNKFDYYLTEVFGDDKKLEEFGHEIVELIAMYREESIKQNESKAFNEFMLRLKDEMRGKDIWYLLLAKEVTLIPKTECPDSYVSQEMADNYTNLSLE